MKGLFQNSSSLSPRSPKDAAILLLSMWLAFLPAANLLHFLLIPHYYNAHTHSYEHRETHSGGCDSAKKHLPMPRRAADYDALEAWQSYYCRTEACNAELFFLKPQLFCDAARPAFLGELDQNQLAWDGLSKLSQEIISLAPKRSPPQTAA